MKILKVIFILGLIVATGILGYLRYVDIKAIEEQVVTIKERDDTISYLQGVNTDLQSQLDSATEKISVYSTTDETEIKAGHRLKRADLQKVNIIKTGVFDDMYITDENIEDYIGSIFKFKVDKNIPIIKSMFRSADQSEQELLYADIKPDVMPLGIRPGDKVQLRFNIVTGESFIVLVNKEVKKIVNNVLQFTVSEAEYNILQSVLADLDDYTKYPGVCKLVAIRYYEDNDDQVAYYPVRNEMRTLIELSPNIEDTTRLLNHDLRSYIDYTMLSARNKMDGERFKSSFSRDADLNAAYEKDLQDESTAPTIETTEKKEVAAPDSTGIFSID